MVGSGYELSEPTLLGIDCCRLELTTLAVKEALSEATWVAETLTLFVRNHYWMNTDGFIVELANVTRDCSA